MTARARAPWYDESHGPAGRRHRRDRLRVFLDRPPRPARPAARLLHHAGDPRGAGRHRGRRSARRADGCCWPASPRGLAFLTKGPVAHRRCRRWCWAHLAGSSAGALRLTRDAGRSSAWLVALAVGAPWYHRDDARPRPGVPRQLLRRRQPRAVRDEPLQRPAAALVLPADRRPAACCRGRPLPLAALPRLVDLGAQARRPSRHDVRLLVVGIPAAAVLHRVDRQATALHPADPAAAGAAARARRRASGFARATAAAMRCCRDRPPSSVGAARWRAGGAALSRAAPRRDGAVGVRLRGSRRDRRDRRGDRAGASALAPHGASRRAAVDPLAGALTLAGLQYGLSPAGRDPVQDMATLVLQHRTRAGADCHVSRVRAEPGLLHGRQADRPARTTNRSSTTCARRSACCA